MSGVITGTFSPTHIPLQYCVSQVYLQGISQRPYNNCNESTIIVHVWFWTLSVTSTPCFDSHELAQWKWIPEHLIFKAASLTNPKSTHASKDTQTCIYIIPFGFFLPSTHAWFSVVNKLKNACHPLDHNIGKLIFFFRALKSFLQLHEISDTQMYHVHWSPASVNDLV